jgi:hypothetical protein
VDLKSLADSGSSIKNSTFISAKSLPPDFALIQSMNLPLFLSSDVYTDVCFSPLGKKHLSTWVVNDVVVFGATIRDPDTSPGALGEVRLSAASIESSDADVMPLLLPVGFRVRNCLFCSVE